MNRKVQKAIRLIAGIVVGYLLGVMIVPYIKVEILTLLHGKEFSGLEKQTNMLAESEYFKVFAFDREHLAQVYYVEKNHSSGNLFTFIKEDEEWKLYQWDTIWSLSGSADDIIWPFYP